MESKVARQNLGLVFNFCDAFSRFFVCHQELNIENLYKVKIIELELQTF
jgi:hypothetical protein